MVSPVVEECYFRGYLLRRLPVTGWGAVPLSAALFAMPALLAAGQLAADLRSGAHRHRPGGTTESVRLGIVMHVLTNSFGILVG